MDYDGFERQCYEFRDKELNTIIDNRKCNSDVVIDPYSYFNSALPRILWVLKEPYGNDGINQAYDKQRATCISDIWRNGDNSGKQTFLPMIKLANYIAGNGLQYKTVQSYTYFKQTTGYINIKKVPGKSRSSDTEISSSFLIPEYNSMINSQVKIYNPDVIIFGNTFSCISQEFLKNNSFFGELKKKKLGEESKLNISEISIFGDRVEVSDCLCFLSGVECCGDLGVYSGDRLYFDAYHPSYSKFSNNYISFIADEIIRWYQNKN